MLVVLAGLGGLFLGRIVEPEPEEQGRSNGERFPVLANRRGQPDRQRRTDRQRHEQNRNREPDGHRPSLPS
ncbi:MAG: hypothetical protein ISR49_10170 [Alphaproteobacteria bacterium]|nr:hypothetical protein [Alphaproteobacteria bacterium]